MIPKPNEPVLFTALTLAIVTLRSQALKAQATKDQELKECCGIEIDRLDKRRAELLEQMENRVGGS